MFKSGGLTNAHIHPDIGVPDDSVIVRVGEQVHTSGSDGNPSGSNYENEGDHQNVQSGDETAVSGGADNIRPQLTHPDLGNDLHHGSESHGGLSWLPADDSASGIDTIRVGFDQNTIHAAFIDGHNWNSDDHPQADNHDRNSGGSGVAAIAAEHVHELMLARDVIATDLNSDHYPPGGELFPCSPPHESDYGEPGDTRATAAIGADLHGDLGTATLHDALALSSGSFATQMHI